MFKVVTHVLVFAIGAGVGVYWGVHNPTEAQKAADFEQARIEQAKQLGKATKQTINQSVPATP
jgi:hypothetical protein